jgi:hypothetical protein
MVVTVLATKGSRTVVKYLWSVVFVTCSWLFVVCQEAVMNNVSVNVTCLAVLFVSVVSVGVSIGVVCSVFAIP